MDKLVKTNEISVLSTKEHTVITVNNYDCYQNPNFDKKATYDSTYNPTYDQPTINIDNSVQNDIDEKKATYNPTYIPTSTNKYNKYNKRITIERAVVVKFSKREDISNAVMQELADKHQVPLAFVEDCWDTAGNWLDSKAKTQKNYKAFLDNWVKRERATWVLKLKQGNNFQKRGGYADISE